MASRLSRILLLWSLVLAGLAVADLGILYSRQATCNTETNRTCWTDGFDISTDYETATPYTGRTRTYVFNLTEIDNWTGGDGVGKTAAMLINGQFPGPTIFADWGDRINVTVHNNLVTNGTTIHWHGLRQLYSNTQDGTAGITECPTPPGSTQTYSFMAEQYGTSWYHSHFSNQYGNGVVGPIVINGPTSANFDVDLGPMMISDWYYGGVDAVQHHVNNPNTPFIAGFPGAPPPSDNVLFNGQNIDPLGRGKGQYSRTVLTPNKKHKLRIINPSVENTFLVTLVNHQFTVVATDLVPIEPVTVSSIFVGIGQRYDVIIEANQAAANYWLNVTFSTAPCGSSKNGYPAAIVGYSGASSTDLPTYQGSAPADTYCSDVLTYQPIVIRTANTTALSASLPDALNVKLRVDDAVERVFWDVNSTPMNVTWNSPTLKYVQSSNVSAMSGVENVLNIVSANKNVYWIMQNNSSIPHPVHLHGHDFLVLGASPALQNPLDSSNSLRKYNPSLDQGSLKGNNPTRRDSTMLPAWGWLAVAFRADNPGAWLFHCHVAWHVSQGLAVQFLELKDSIPLTNDLNALNDNCAAWNSYYPSQDPFLKFDSGI